MLAATPEHSRLYDVTADPHELEESQVDPDNPIYQSLADANTHMRLFANETQIKNVFTEPVINQANVRTTDHERHKADRSWFKEQCKTFLASK